jgi:hypothetical protein
MYQRFEQACGLNLQDRKVQFFPYDGEGDAMQFGRQYTFMRQNRKFSQ